MKKSKKIIAYIFRILFIALFAVTLKFIFKINEKQTDKLDLENYLKRSSEAQNKCPFGYQLTEKTIVCNQENISND